MRRLKFTQLDRIPAASRASPQKHVPITLVGISYLRLVHLGVHGDYMPVTTRDKIRLQRMVAQNFYMKQRYIVFRYRFTSAQVVLVFRSEYTMCTCSCTGWKKQVSFSTVIRNVELMHECFSKHWSMGIARMKQSTDTRKKVSREEWVWK